ncbi:MAG: ABC transporter ATP-binding protein [Lachnospiraceae bacterium]|jgi:ABC-2 type transport system ATP-binding protein|nr:ABC transporter ATP-binding protein [Lachnospiraceae bacterium]
MVEIKNLIKMYGKFTAVDNLNLNIPEGAIYGFVGPNGAGKTTTMKIMSGLLTATGGEVFIDNTDVVKNPLALKEKIGYMPDFFGVYDNLKVSEYMDFYEGAYYIPYNERKELTESLLELVDLSEKKEEYVDSLSRGMKQRLCVARCLIHDPKVVILDEPASGLDPRARIELKEILKQLRQMGKTIIISSHILSELSEMCTHVAIIDRGKIMISGSMADVMRSLSVNRTFNIRPLEKIQELISLLEEKPDVSDIYESTDNVEFSYKGKDEDFALLVKEIILKDIPIINIKEKEGNLEQIFMEVTGSGKAFTEGENANA